MKELTLRQLAQQSGVQVETIKFYKRRGLIEQSPRPEPGFRTYSAETCQGQGPLSECTILDAFG